MSLHLFRVRWKMELDGYKLVGHDRWSTNQRLMKSQIRMNYRDYLEMEFALEKVIISEKDGHFKIFQDKKWDIW